MDVPVELWRRLIFLRTWVYFFAVVTYLFIGNLWWTMVIVEAIEAVHSFLVHVRMERVAKGPGPTRRFYFWLDLVLSVVMGVAASLSIVLVEYVFNTVVFIGTDRTAFYVVFLVLVFATRCLLLFVRDQMFSLLAVFFAFLLLFLFAVMGTNEIFFNDARTVTISVVYMLYTIVTAMLFIRWIGYWGYVVHALGLVIVLSIFWHKHSSIPFSRYVNWRHPI